MAAYTGFMTHVTCQLTAKNRDQLGNPTLDNRVWATFTFSTTQRKAWIEKLIQIDHLRSLCVCQCVSLCVLS